MDRARDPAKRIIFLVSCVIFSASLQPFSVWFIYWRPVLFNQFWRLWTAHWVHVGWIHFILNMLAFIAFILIFPKVKIKHIATQLLILPIFISLNLYYFMPHLQAYAGLSGVLHGMYTATALVLLNDLKQRKLAFMVLLLITAKIIKEQIWSVQTTAQLIGSPVLIESHLLGVVGGILLAGYYYLIQQKLVK